MRRRRVIRPRVVKRPRRILRRELRMNPVSHIKVHALAQLNRNRPLILRIIEIRRQIILPAQRQHRRLAGGVRHRPVIIRLPGNQQLLEPVIVVHHIVRPRRLLIAIQRRPHIIQHHRQRPLLPRLRRRRGRRLRRSRRRLRRLPRRRRRRRSNRRRLLRRRLRRLSRRRRRRRAAARQRRQRQYRRYWQQPKPLHPLALQFHPFPPCLARV